jgi:alkylation response protein AidB-like acyl-CoA dehydrogenase
MGELGLFGMYLPLNMVARVWIPFLISFAVEEFPGLTDHRVLLLRLIIRLASDLFTIIGTKEQKEEYLPKLCTGERHFGHLDCQRPEAGLITWLEKPVQ